MQTTNNVVSYIMKTTFAFFHHSFMFIHSFFIFEICALTMHEHVVVFNRIFIF